jgi:hypothetical protein
VYVDAPALATQGDLEYWVGLVLDYNPSERDFNEHANSAKPIGS